MKRSLLTALVALVLVPSLALGQAQTTSSVRGTVLNEAGEPVSGAEITLESPAIQGVRTFAPGANGQFLASLLPPGQYSAAVTAPGYQATVISFRLLVGDTVPLDIVLLPGADVTEEIVVHGRLSAMQTPETRRSFDYTEEIEELPGFSRDIHQVSYAAPNTSFGPNANQVAIAGAPAFDTVVLLDGAEISDPYFGSGTTVYLEDSIQEVQVLTTGISARYGRFQGGVINAITKSGGNEFSATLRTELSKQKWNEQTPFKETQSDVLNETYQATLGGYILKDRLWFFGGYRTIPETSTSVTTRTTAQSYTTTANEDRFQIKLRGAITDRHIIDASYLEFEAETSPYAGLPAGDLRALGIRSDPRDMTSITYQGVLGQNTFVDAIATEKNVNIISGGSPSGGDPFLWTAAGNWVYNNHWWDATDPSVRDNETMAANMTHVLDTAGWGSHLLQGGVQMVTSNTAGDNRQTATGFNLVGTTGTFVSLGGDGNPRFNLVPGGAQRWRATNLQANNEVENLALYVQDGVTWNKFRFDVGLRYDRYEGSTTGVDAFNSEFNEISPRLAVTYNISPTWQLIGSVGRYVGRFNDGWGEDASGVSSAPRLVDVYVGPTQSGLNYDQAQAALRNNANWQLAAVVGDPAFPTTFLADDVTSPSTTETNLSLRTALPRNTGFASVTYTHREYEDLMTGFVGLVCTDYGLSFDRPCPAGDFSPAPGGARVDTTVLANDDRTKRDYNALAFQVDYRPSARLTINGSWTWADTKGNYEGEALNQPASLSVFGARERAIQLASAAPYGYLASHIRHRVNLGTTYRWNLGRWGNLSTSAIAFYQSGRVWSRTAAVPLANVAAYASSTGTYTHFFDGRGENDFNSQWALDTAVRYALPVFRELDFFVKLDIRNILNNDELINHQVTGTAVAVNNANGTFSHRTWAPTGSCGVNSTPSRTCTGFGRIAGQQDYQLPRAYLISVGLQF